MKRILVPTDFSENAWNALCYALHLFKEEDCRFFLLNTYTPAISNSRFMAATMENGLLSNAAQQSSVNGLKAFLERAEEAFPNPKHSFETISSFSLLVDEVVSAIAAHNIDLLVTGTKGASGAQEVFMGSNTVRMVKAVKDCPILAIPDKFKYLPPKEIAFATDFNRFYTASELRPLLEMARAYKAVIRVVYVQERLTDLSEMQQFNLNMLRKYLGHTEHYIHTVSEVNTVSETLDTFSEDLEIHLLAMLNYHHSYLERLTREPIVKRMAFHTKNPLLVIPELGMGLNGRERALREKKERVSVSR